MPHTYRRNKYEVCLNAFGRGQHNNGMQRTRIEQVFHHQWLVRAADAGR
jgi:hypothetical protein